MSGVWLPPHHPTFRSSSRTATKRLRLRGARFREGLILAMFSMAPVLLVAGMVQGSQPLVILVLTPVTILLINQFPRAALIGAIPALLVSDQLVSASVSVRLALAIVGVWGLGVLTRRWRPKRFHLLLAIFAGVLVLSLVSSTRAPSPTSATHDLLTLLCGVGLCATAASVRPPVRAVLGAIGGAGLLASLAILSGTFGGVTHSLEAFKPQGLDRVSAFGLNPNYLGAVLAIGVVALIGLALERRSPWIAVAALPILAAMPSVKSRATLLNMVIGLAVLVFARRELKTRSAVIIGSLVLVLATPNLLYEAQQAALGERATVDLSQSDATRLVAAEVAFRQGAQNPLLGIGYGNFPARALGDSRLGTFINTHNDYLRLFAESGVFAIACLVALIAVAIKASRQVPDGRPAMAVILTYALILLSSNTLSSLPVTAGVWVLIGTIVGHATYRGSRWTELVDSEQALA